jgi:sugar lactone lactonase YvrE
VTVRSNVFRAAGSLLLAVVATLGLARAASPAPIRSVAMVSTLSGTGEVGFADGKSGSFVMPTGVAYDAAGNVYVADGGAQRIRRVDADGTVRTIAGGGAIDASGFWVTGGYADGRAGAARFNRPAGIAIRSDGTIYVADTLNHCIRRIDAQGTVTTYAGSPATPGHLDGPRATARFGLPTGLAVDRHDVLYVADYTGIRTIDADGNVATIRSLGIEPYAVAVFDGPVGVTVFAGDQEGIVARRPGRAPSEDRGYAWDGVGNARRTFTTSAQQPLGVPAFLAALDDTKVAFTELRSNTVRTLETISGQSEIVAGHPNFDGSGDSGGYADGPGTAAAFFTPLGIARAPDGGLLVADGGNRRLRKLSPTDRADPWAQLDLAFPGVEENPDPAEYRIAYVGNSYIYDVTDWPTSIEGMLADHLSSAPSLVAIGKHPKVVPVIKLANAEIESFADLCVQTGFYDLVVLNWNLGDVFATYENEQRKPDLAAPDWPGALTHMLVDVNRKLSAKHIGFVVVIHPVPDGFAPSEGTWYPIAKQFAPPYVMAPDATAERELVTAVGRSGVAVVDVHAAFAGEERAADHVPLFGTSDFHFTVRARRIIAEALAARLRELAPWQSGAAAPGRSK